MSMRRPEPDSPSPITMLMRCWRAIRYAEEIYYDRKRSWNKIVERAMKKDFSWNNSARQYEELYDSL